LRRLLGHGAANFGYSVADVNDRRLACRVEKFASVGRKNPGAFSTDSDGKILAKTTWEKGGVV